jgi:hypothetical protein
MEVKKIAPFTLQFARESSKGNSQPVLWRPINSMGMSDFFVSSAAKSKGAATLDFVFKSALNAVKTVMLIIPIVNTTGMPEPSHTLLAVVIGNL